MVLDVVDHDLTCEERLSDSPYVESVWRSRTDKAGSFISIAQTRWSIVVTKMAGQTYVTIRGPEIRATPAFAMDDAEFIGIMFKAGTLMPTLPARDIMDRADVTLSQSTRHSFQFNSTSWEFPTYDNVECFVNRLVRDELIVHEPIVSDVLAGLPVESSLRTVQRRFLNATGLTHSTIAQIRRARQATRLLKKGISVQDAVYHAGYADQAHMTRSLKRFIGLTPGQISDPYRDERLSFLFNTLPD